MNRGKNQTVGKGEWGRKVRREKEALEAEMECIRLHACMIVSICVTVMH